MDNPMIHGIISPSPTRTNRISYRLNNCMTHDARRLVKWLLIALLAAMASYVAFRGYLSPEMLLNFANSFYC